jgi:hypothetical protein
MEYHGLIMALQVELLVFPSVPTYPSCLGLGQISTCVPEHGRSRRRRPREGKVDKRKPPDNWTTLIVVAGMDDISVFTCQKKKKKTKVPAILLQHRRWRIRV